MSDRTRASGRKASRCDGLARLPRRAVGRLVDVALWAVFFLALAVITGREAADGEMTYPEWFWYASALVPIGYEGLMVRFGWGQTLGKRWSKTRVAAVDGGTPGLMRAVVRGAMTWPFLVVASADHLGSAVQLAGIGFYVIVFATVATNSDLRGIHDLVAGTIVREAEKHSEPHEV